VWFFFRELVVAGQGVLVVRESVEIPVVWLQGATCTGCSISVLNAIYPSPANLLLEELVPGKHISLRFHMTLMAGSGEPVIEILNETKKELPKGYVLVMEGAIPTAVDGLFCTVGERDGKPITLKEHATELAKNAMAVIALGTCASFGGIPSGRPNPTGAMGIVEFMRLNGIDTPSVCVPGCPAHPDWFVGTCAHIMLFGLPKEEQLDEHGRMKLFYGKLIHDNCPRRGYFDTGRMAREFGKEGCLYELGCKGYVTTSDCPLRKWNSGTNWCIDNGHPCIGCCEPGFPDIMSPLYEPFSEERLPKLQIDEATGKLRLKMEG
jgi:hydrogenase small subunit